MRQTNKTLARLRTTALTALLLGLSACSQEAEVVDTVLTRLEISAPTPHELIFSTVKDTPSPPQTVTLSNVGTAPLELHTLSVSGPDADAFTLAPATLPLTLVPGEHAEVAVVFAPQRSGVKRAQLRVDSSDPDAATLSIGLHGLAADGLQGTLEPPLQAIADTLGYDVDVGGDALKLGTQAEPIGDEVLVPLFERAGPGPVTLRVVARYGPEEPFPYGFFTLGGTDEAGLEPRRREVGRIAAENAQELLPLLGSGSVTFDPGNEPFGVYGQAGGETQSSLDALNSGEVEHALRVYPLHDRDGNLVSGSYLIGLEEAQNGDYQDAVFVISNVRPAR